MTSSARLLSLATASSSNVSEDVVELISNIRFITTSVYVFLILEHISTIPQEVEYVWKAPRSPVRFLFLLFRYSTLGGITLLTHSMAGIVSPLSQNIILRVDRLPSCKHVVAGLTALSVLAMGIADMIVMLRVSVLWGRQRHVLSVLATAFILTYSATIACAVVAASQLVEFTSYMPLLRLCIPVIKPSAILGVWVPGMAFDALVLTMTSLNSCSRPRTAATPLSTALYRDGLTFFLVIAGLRALNLFMTLFSQVYLVGICISWPISAIVLSRLIFHLQRIEKTTMTPDNSVCDDPIDEDVVESKESVVLDISSPRGKVTPSKEPNTTLRMWEIMEVQSTQGHNRSISLGSGSLLETHECHSLRDVT